MTTGTIVDVAGMTRSKRPTKGTITPTTITSTKVYTCGAQVEALHAYIALQQEVLLRCTQTLDPKKDAELLELINELILS